MNLRPLLFAGLSFLSLSGAAAAASFDCAKARTPFEKAICGHEELSLADERLTLSYETAIGGLSPDALAILRGAQRSWHSFAQRACTPDAQPLQSGGYDERGLSCLVELFDKRSDVLETSRIIDGRRYYPISAQAALPDPYEADNPDSYWPVAKHELSLPQLDGKTPLAAAFNAYVKEEAVRFSSLLGAGGEASSDETEATSDSDVELVFNDQAGDRRITLRVTNYWFGHGAAHGNWGIVYLHYLIGEDRSLRAEDIFTGKRWQSALVRLTAEALRAEHGDNLFFDDDAEIADMVIDPSRWDLSDDRDLIIQFNPYDIAAYAYGAPVARIAWDDLEPYLSETANGIRYGY